MISVHHPTDRPNFCVVHIGEISLWFSYETCIAFCAPGAAFTISQNCWGPTTGKHLNYIDTGVSRRLDRLEFEKRLGMVISPYIMQELALT